ncbi:MAG: hypothetical protein AAF349_00275 [Cyanobacteria bacterium P01_A01_bin.68]
MPVPSTPSYSKMSRVLQRMLEAQIRNQIRVKRLQGSLNTAVKTTKTAASQVKIVKKNLTRFEKILKASSKITEALKKGLFKEINPKLASVVSNATSLFSAGLTVMSIKNREYIQGIELNINGIINKDLDESFSQAINNTRRFRELRADFLQFEKDYKQDKSYLQASIGANLASSNRNRQTIEKVKKQANDALYEVRVGREKLESKIAKVREDYNNFLTQLVEDIAIQLAELVTRIEEARKLGNDALYEVRNGNSQQVINNLTNQFNTKLTSLENTFQKTFNTQIKQIQQKTDIQLKQAQQKVDAQVKSLFKNSNNIINSALAKAKKAESNTNILSTRILAMQLDISRLKKQVNLPSKNLESTVKRLISTSPTIQGLVAALKAAGVRVDGIEKYILPTLGDSLKTVATKVQIVDGRLTKVEKTLQNGVEIKGLNVTNARIQGLNVAVDKSNLAIDSNLKEIKKLDSKIQERNKLDTKALNKIDRILGLIPLIPARSAGLIKPSIPTLPQIETATATGVCRSTAPGGCMNKSLGDTANRINNNTNNSANNLLNKINAGANAGQLALLTTINNKLGPQLTGGVSTFLTTFFQRFQQVAQWLQLDRVLNILTWWQTLHNASMLSSDIVNTLAQGMDNVLAFIGIKDAEGNDISIGSIIGKAYREMLISALGQDTYNNLNKTWNAANRIYQSGANIVNSVLSIQQSILTALEAVGAGVGKLANALRAAGQVFDNAYEWMNPHPNYDNRVFAFLNRLQDTASMVETVTQTPLDIKSAVDGIKEEKNQMKEALKDTEEGLKGLGVIESESEKKAQEESKAVSGGADLTAQDKLEAE